MAVRTTASTQSFVLADLCEVLELSNPLNVELRLDLDYLRRVRASQRAEG